MVKCTLPLLALVVAACTASPTEAPSAPITSLPRTLTEAETQVALRSNAFAFDLLKRVAADRDSNAFVSPLSISMALGMVMNGAANATLDSMRATLGFEGMALADINAGYRGLIDLLKGLDRSTEMRIGNAVWFRRELQADADFRQALETNFDAAVRSLDFGLPTAKDTMNLWAKSATNGRIPSIVEAVNDGHVMFLLNAIYFRGQWREQFDPAETRASGFAAYDGPQTVQMMHRADMKVRLLERPGVAIAELPYGNSAFAMTLVMPEPGGDIHTLIDTLTPERWDEWMAAADSTSILVRLPRFRLEYTRSLIDDLTALGMGVAFEPGVADFRNLFEPNRPGPFITSVAHKTFLEINEEGTEAAAVTSIGVGVVSVPPTFSVDRPFLLVIRERFSGTVLFLGKILRVPE
jgi:serine protease inhibitor